VRVAADAGVPTGMTGCQPLAQPSFALDARLQMIRHARSSIDLQTYVLADDGVGRLVLGVARGSERLVLLIASREHQITVVLRADERVEAVQAQIRSLLKSDI